VVSSPALQRRTASAKAPATLPCTTQRGGSTSLSLLQPFTLLERSLPTARPLHVSSRSIRSRILVLKGNQVSDHPYSAKLINYRFYNRLRAATRPHLD